MKRVRTSKITGNCLTSYYMMVKRENGRSSQHLLSVKKIFLKSYQISLVYTFSVSNKKKNKKEIINDNVIVSKT